MLSWGERKKEREKREEKSTSPHTPYLKRDREKRERKKETGPPVS